MPALPSPIREPRVRTLIPLVLPTSHTATGLTLFVCLLAFFLLAALSSFAASDPPDAEPHAPPDRRELWVPTQQLKQILAKHPKAVVLSREQYETLLRDADLDRKAAPEAPRRAVLASASYQAHLAGKTVQVTGAFKVNVLSDEWAQLPLNFEGVTIGALTVDGEAALIPDAAPAPVTKQAQAQSKAAAPEPSGGSLLLRGRGERVVTIEFTIPISSAEGLSQFQIKLQSAAASVFSLNLPSNQHVESAQAIAIKKTPDATAVVATLSPSDAVLNLKWRGVGGSDQSLQPVAAVEMGFVIDPEKVLAEYDFDLSAPLGKLPDSYSIPLPANAKIIEVTGDEIDKWETPGGKLQIHFQPRERSTAKLRIALEIPSLAGGASATLALPIPEIEGLVRYQGALTVRGDEGVTVKDITTDDTLLPAVFKGKPAPHFIASYRFTTPPNSPRVIVEKVHPRFSADLDSLVEFKQEAVFIERTLTLHPEKGELFSVALTIPKGEEVLAVHNGDESEPDWQIHDRKVGLRWTTNPAGKAERVFKIRTRIEPTNWSKLDGTGLTFALEDLKIEGAERVTGYIALKADDAFRLEAEPSETLERRDGRTTPVKGDYAWFRGADFTLRIKVAKRPGEVLASLTGYALPLEGVLDLHAQIDYTFLHSGARSVRIRVPKEIAANFHFEGPQIAERNLAGDIWTIVFQKELTGAYPMKVTAQVQSGNTSLKVDGVAPRAMSPGILPVTPARPGPATTPSATPPEGAAQSKVDGAAPRAMETAIPPVTPSQQAAVPASVPSTQSAAAPSPTPKETRFEVAVPVITPLDVVRTGGAWAIEANTETEITFAAHGMNEVDSLLAPKLDDYSPRHRVIGVFTWLGPDYSLTLSGVRHAAASVLTSVVDRMNLDTVVSSSGTERNQATFDLRTAGAQYLDVELPAKSSLLSLTVNDDLIKPVGDRPDQVRVELPGTSVSSGTLKVSILYETPKAPWKGGGSYAVHAPKLARSIPILRSQWRLFLPDGFQYTGIDGNLSVPEITPEPPLIIAVAKAFSVKRLYTRVEPPDFSAPPIVLSPEPALQSLNSSDTYAGSFWEKKTSGSTNRLYETVDETTFQSPAEREQAGRTFIESGDKAARSKEHEKAATFYKKACDIIPKSPASQTLYEHALNAFCDAACNFAEQRIAEGRNPDAETILKTILNDNYDPNYKRAIILLVKIEPAFDRKAIIPQLRAQVEKEKQLYREAQDFYDSQRYDLANKRCDQILAINKYNASALKLQEKIAAAMNEYGVSAQNQTRSDPMNRLNLGWSKPVKRYESDRQTSAAQERTLAAQTKRIEDKLRRIVLPKLEFREATIREAIDFLKKKSIELDTDSPPGSRGVNIVLKLDSGSPPEAQQSPPPPANIPGIEPIPGFPDGPKVPQPPPDPVNTSPSDARITVSLTNIPLIEALRYITNLASLKFKIEPYAVFVVPQSVNTDVLITKEWKVRPDFVPQNKSAKDWLISNGVQFQGGASAVYLPSASRLIVRNTQDQLDLIDTMKTENVPQPEQVDFRSIYSNNKRGAHVRRDPIKEKLENIVIPRLEFREATLRDAFDFLIKRARELDTESPAGERGVNIDLSALNKPVPPNSPENVNLLNQRITVSLTNIPLIEALRYITNLGGLKFKVTTQGVSVVEQSVNTDVLITKEWQIHPSLVSKWEGAGDVRDSAKKWLVEGGVQFNGAAEIAFYPGVGRQKMSLPSNGSTTSSMFLPSFGRLVVKNTEDQLELIDTVLDANDFGGGDSESDGLQRISGLLPMKLDLPIMGRMIVLEGLAAAERVEFHYEDWWSRARHLWLWCVGGGLAALLLAQGRPWWRTLWAILALTFFPLVAMAGAMPVCNALLAGWLASVVIQRVAVRLVFAARRKAVTA